MISIQTKGDFKRLNNFLETALEKFNLGILNKYAEEGLAALRAYTPRDTGKTADSWSYEIKRTEDGIVSVIYNNSNVIDYVPIAIILQYGHATRNGGWVEGIDYINPALVPVFNNLVRDMWNEIVISYR